MVENIKKIRYRYSCQYVAVIMLVALLLLIWYGFNRYSNFKNQQRMFMERSVNSAVSELTILLNQLQKSAYRFTQLHLSLIQNLAMNPEDETMRKKLEGEAAGHFHDFFALTIADSKGNLILGNYDLTVNELCQRAIREFIQAGYNYDIFIHPHVNAYHFDIMIPWPYYGSEKLKGIFFVSIKPAAFSRVLRTAEVFGHTLYLIKKDIAGLIELSSSGSRIDMDSNGGNFFLSPKIMKKIAVSVPVPGTRWDLVAIPNADIMASKRNNIILQTTLIYLGIVLLSLLFLRLIRREEDLHYKTAQRYKQTKEKLEYALDFSNVTTWEYDLLTKKFNWSERAVNLFGSPVPETYDDYSEVVLDEFKDDFRLFIKNCTNSMFSQHFEHMIKNKDLGDIWLEIKGSHESDDKLCTFKLRGLIQNITDRKVAEQNHIIFELKQKDTLLREVHHRIKNTLQGIMSLLQQHKSRLSPDRAIFDHAISQLHSVSLIHEVNGDTMDGKIELSSLVNKICESAFNLRGICYTPCSSITKKYIYNKGTNNAIAIALIINELVFNAVKHTVKSHYKDISVNIILSFDAAIIEIMNPGNGLADNFDFERGLGLGTGLTLTRSLLPKRGAKITFTQSSQSVICRLTLCSPILETNYGSTGEKRIDSA